MTTLAERILAARGGESREKLAPRIDKSAGAIRNWEKGYNEPSDGDLMLLAQATGTNYQWLRTGQGDMHPPESRRGSFPTSRTGDVPIVTDTGPGYATGAASPQPEVPMVQVSPEVLATLAAAGVIILADPSTILSLIDRNAKREPIRLRVAIDDDPPDDADAAT